MDNMELDYQGIKESIRKELNQVAERFVVIGYRLKQVRDGKLYKIDGHSNINEFAKSEYNISQSVTSRFMAINDRFSINGNSEELLPEYKGYGSSKLAEMLTLTEEELKRVTVTTTKVELRDMKTNRIEYIESDVNKEIARREYKLEALNDDKFINELRKRAQIKLDAINLLKDNLKTDGENQQRYCPHCNFLLN